MLVTQNLIKDQETLPRWNLTDLYSSVDDEKISEDLKDAKDKAQAFSNKYNGMFVEAEKWQPCDLLSAIQDYEVISEILQKLGSYAGLFYYTNLKDSKAQQFNQKIQEKVTEIASHLIFFTLDLNKIEDVDLQNVYQAEKGLVRYKSWFDNLRAFRPHQLSPDLEKLFMEKSLTSSSAWGRLFEETLTGIKFTVDDKALSITQVLDYMSHKDPEQRLKGATSLSKGLSDNIGIFTFITNTLAKDKEIEDTWRHYPTPTTERHLANQVEGEVIEALASAVKASYPSLSHRYYAIKAKILGVKKLEYWDRNSPLPHADDQYIDYEQAKSTVLNAYQAFSPKMAELGQRFFDKGWIDVPPYDGKTSGAFSHSTVPSVHPYILLNYQGKMRNVMTLAHELGHGVHQILAGEQGVILSSTPLTIAETASVFGEMLTFRSLLANTKDQIQRRNLLASKVEDMLNTVVRQIAFYEFEKQIHDGRRLGELSPDDIGEIWFKTQAEALGPSVNIDPIVRPFWSYISHFIHSPFYVYAYAFGDCLVNSLYAVYQTSPDGFVERYIEMLQKGGSERYSELLAPFGLNARDPLFWQKGLDMISGFIDELEAI